MADPFQLGASESSGSGGGGLGGLASGLLGMIPGLGGLFGGGGSKQSQEQTQSQSQTQANQQTMNFIQANPGPADALGALATPLPAMFPSLGSAGGVNFNGFSALPSMNMPGGGGGGGAPSPYGSAPSGAAGMLPMSAIVSALSRGGGIGGAPQGGPQGVQVPISSEGGQALGEFNMGNPQYEGAGAGTPGFPSALLPPQMMMARAMQVGGGGVPVNTHGGGGFVPPPPPMMGGAPVQAAQALQSAQGDGGGGGTALPAIPKPGAPPVAPQRQLGKPMAQHKDLAQLDQERQQKIEEAKANIQIQYGPEIERLENEFDESQQSVADDRHQLHAAESLFQSAGGRGYDLAKSQILAEKRGTDGHPVQGRVMRGLAGFLTSSRPFAAAVEASNLYDDSEINARAAVYAEKFQTQAERLHKDALEMYRADSTRMRTIGGQLASTRTKMMAAMHSATNEVYKGYGQDLNELKREDSFNLGSQRVQNAADSNANNAWYRDEKLKQGEAGLAIKNYNAETGRMGVPIRQQQADASSLNAQTNIDREIDYRQIAGAAVGKESRIAGSADRNQIMSTASRLMAGNPAMSPEDALSQARKLLEGASAGPAQAAQGDDEKTVRRDADALLQQGQHDGKSIAQAKRDAERVINAKLQKQGKRFSFSEGLVREAAAK